MPATLNTLSPRQQSYIADLARNRNLSVLPPLVRVHVTRAAEGTLPRSEASHLIDTLSAMPRAQRSTPSASASAERVPTPSFETRAGRMLQAGGIEATVSLPTGHVTVRVSTRRQVGRGWANCGPRDEGARINVSVLGQKRGWINVDEQGNWLVTFRTRNENVKRAVEEIFAYAAGLATDYTVREASRCGRCFRTLTDPVSIDRGIGPECFGRTTESHHANVRENVQAQPAPRTLNSQEIRERNSAIDTLLNPPADTLRNVEQDEQSVVREALEFAADALRTPSLAEAARALQTPEQLDSEVQRARDIIAEALDAYGESEATFALQVFDRLAG